MSNVTRKSINQSRIGACSCVHLRTLPSAKCCHCVGGALPSMAAMAAVTAALIAAVAQWAGDGWGKW